MKDHVCYVSTGICGRFTFGSGILDAYSYWEFPCYKCAREHEEKFNSPECWPLRKENIDE